MNSPAFRIYTDGASSGNPGPSGWGAVVIGDGRRVEIGGAEILATNNQMELRSVIEALGEIPPDASATVYSDSAYVVDGMNRHILKWRRNGFMKVDQKPVENRELWEDLDRISGARATFVKVSAHSGNRENERANDIAQGFSRGRRVKLRNEAHEAREAATVSTTPVSIPKRIHFPCYVVCLKPDLAFYSDWDSCRRAVEGVRGVRYKKCKTREDLDFTLEKWGLAALN